MAEQQQFAIDKAVPMPAPRNSYPWASMEVGDSFHAKVERYKLNAAATAAGKTLGIKFSVRPDGDGFRVWRVA